MAVVVDALLWFAAIGCGLLGGLFFAFSAFVMRALGSLDPPVGIAAMNAINRDILRSWFMPLFWGTTLAALALAVLGALHWRQPGAMAMLAAGVVHVFGVFVCTVAIEVPQNNRLQAVDHASTPRCRSGSATCRNGPPGTTCARSPACCRRRCACSPWSSARSRLTASQHSSLLSNASQESIIPFVAHALGSRCPGASGPPDPFRPQPTAR